MSTRDELLRDLFDRDELTRAVLSRPSGRGHARKVVVEPVALKAGPAYRFTRHYADRTTDENLPAAQAEARVGELLHAATSAIVGEVPLNRLRHAVPCFPTRSEIWLTLLAKAGV
jgi:hypothetical protein